MPDGLAFAKAEHYAIIWDAKIRSGGYTMGTDDRAILQYIKGQLRFFRREGIQNCYYLIVSSRFNGEFKKQIHELRMATGIMSVCLMEATALVELVSQKLRRHWEISLGFDGIEPIFSSNSVINAAYVLEKLDELT